MAKNLDHQNANGPQVIRPPPGAPGAIHPQPQPVDAPPTTHPALAQCNTSMPKPGSPFLGVLEVESNYEIPKKINKNAGKSSGKPIELKNSFMHKLCRTSAPGGNCIDTSNPRSNCLTSFYHPCVCDGSIFIFYLLGTFTNATVSVCST